MKKLVMIILPCIIVLILIWGYVPAARELANKIGDITAHLKIQNLDNLNAKENSNIKNDEQQASQAFTCHLLLLTMIKHKINKKIVNQTIKPVYTVYIE